MNKIITFSGVHGAGKSTSISGCSSYFDACVGPDRPKNPFLTPYEAMLFFVSSFTWRDTELDKKCDYVFLDRWSLIDISVYADSLMSLGRITEKQANIIKDAIRSGPASNIRPAISFLIDVEPETILRRIEKFRTPSKHHIFERDIEFIECLRELFLLKFNSDKLNGIRTHIIRSGDRSQDSINNEIISIINEVTADNE